MQVSMQQPLSEQWMEEPVVGSEPFVRAVNPTFRDFLPANEARRMGNLMKRALVTALKVLADTGIEHPDAIITGTSLGCMESTEKFLGALVENGEQTLSPTFFMQSTHNTVGSALGIHTKSHGYNTTYSHGTMSFDMALQDCLMQMQLGKITTALVGGHDEMMDSYFDMLRKAGYVGLEGMVPCGEVAVSMMVSTNDSADRLCEIAGMCIFNSQSADDIKVRIESMLSEASMTAADISAVMTGVNGNAANDSFYTTMVETAIPGVPHLRYKHLFGENFTASAFGVYAAAHCLKRGYVPPFMYCGDRPLTMEAPQGILLCNHAADGETSLIILK